MKGLLSLTAACGIAVACCAAALAEGVTSFRRTLHTKDWISNNRRDQALTVTSKPRRVHPGPLATRARTPAIAGVPRR